jgi:hypothetical protein
MHRNPSELHEIWPWIISPSEPGTGITYFAKAKHVVTGGRCRTVESLERVVKNLTFHHYAVYVNLNPSRHSGIKGTSNDVTHWRNVVVDIDPVLTDAKPMSALEIVGLHLPTLADALVLDTGRGIQVWLPIEPVELNAQNRSKIERRVGNWLRWLANQVGESFGCRVDTSCSDLSRVVRVPGSMNHKTGRRACLLKTAEKANDPAVFDAPDPPESVVAGPIKGGLGRKLHLLTSMAARYLFEGVVEPGRHAGAYAAAASLRDIDIPQEDAMRLVVRGATLCSPPLNRQAAIRAVENAYRKVKT